MRVLDRTILNEASVASTTQTDALDMEHMVGVSVHVTASAGTATATLQVSNDKVNWVALPNPVSISGATNNMLYATDLWYKWVRVDLNVSAPVSDAKLHLIAKGM